MICIVIYFIRSFKMPSNRVVVASSIVWHIFLYVWGLVLTFYRVVCVLVYVLMIPFVL